MKLKSKSHKSISFGHQNNETSTNGTTKDAKPSELSAQFGQYQNKWIGQAGSGRDACIEGLCGSFVPMRNDFTINEDISAAKSHFRNDPNWNKQKIERVQKFRFVVCFLGLAALALALMSRVILNVAIVDMAKEDPPLVQISDLESSPEFVAQHETTTTTITTSSPTTTATSLPHAEMDESMRQANETEHLGPEERLKWSVPEQNLLLGSFHIGYIPSMLFSGGLAEKYGAKYPLFLCVFASAVINMFIPYLASTSFTLLIVSRVLLGLLQGGMIPAAYDLFNRWLTLAETSIFVPLVKVSLSAGAFMGSLLPGVFSSMGHKWPSMFRAASLVCALWSVAWLLVATSTPQTNRRVKANELHRIMRKKQQQQQHPPPLKTVASELESMDQRVLSQTNTFSKPSIPWLKIITSPSVIGLTIGKFTYNLGAEFWLLQQSSYLRQIHAAPMTLISAIASAGYLMQMALITFIGWAARVSVERRILDLSRTKWRKIFQGSSNFGMAALYLTLPLVSDSLWLTATFMMLTNFAWMFGAGGESMLPYDLSSQFPATIMGLSHSISVLSGLTIPSVCSLVLAADIADPQRWNLLFLLVGGALTLGGLLFCLLVKAKPFLPGEVDNERRQKETQHEKAAKK